MNDVEELGKKLKDLENSIKEFQENHTNQVNSLIELFSDVLEIIKDKDNKEDGPIDEDLDEIGELKIVDNEFSSKKPKEIVDYIMSISNMNQENNEEIQTSINISDEIDKLEEAKPEIFKINFDDLKIDIEKNINNIQSEIYIIEKSFSPVEKWIDAFKKTDKYINVKNILKNYGVVTEIVENRIEPNKLGLSSLINLKSNSMLYTSPNLNIELGTLEEKGYDDDTPLMVMAINYIDEITNEKITFDLYNCKTNEERTSMINAEQIYLSNNENAKINNFCVASNNGLKLGWTSLSNFNNIIIDEMGLI